MDIPSPFGPAGWLHYACTGTERQEINIATNKGGTIECACNFQYAYRFARADFPRCARFQPRGLETVVKKKIRAIQYGIGPIGASILKLMREKEAIEIIGAIDNDPAKIGKDLGEVVGAADAPWGVKVAGDATGVLEQAADVVMQ